MNINVADTIKIVADRLSPMPMVEAKDILEIRDDQVFIKSIFHNIPSKTASTQ